MKCESERYIDLKTQYICFNLSWSKALSFFFFCHFRLIMGISRFHLDRRPLKMLRSDEIFFFLRRMELLPWISHTKSLLRGIFMMLSFLSTVAFSI